MAPLDHYRRILALARTESKPLGGVAALSALGAALAALQPWPLKMLVDYALGEVPLPGWLETVFQNVGIASGRTELIICAAVVGVLLFAASAGLDAASTIIWSAAGQRLVYRLASDLFLQLQKLSLLFHAKRTVGDALSRLTGDAWSVYIVTDGVLMAPVKHLLTVAFIGALAWQLDSGLTLLILGAAPVLALFAFYFGGRL
jgi:ATP-binding cassette subfamily B protein